MLSPRGGPKNIWGDASSMEMPPPTFLRLGDAPTTVCRFVDVLAGIL